ncbi:MAG: tetratricopeptide repeat protein [Rhodospirillales bacterium]|nr:MAG: tetratricopeptide repeat protein [Rhodospirillales bacterium]
MVDGDGPPRPAAERGRLAELARDIWSAGIRRPARHVGRAAVRAGPSAAAFITGAGNVVDSLRKAIVGAALVLAIGFGVWVIWEAVHSEPIFVEPVHVHKDLDGRLPPGDVMAQRLASHFGEFASAVAEMKAEREMRFGGDRDIPKLEIPGVGLSLQSLVTMARRLLDRREHRVIGDVSLDTAPAAAAASATPAADACKSRTTMLLRVRSDRHGEIVRERWEVCAAREGGPLLVDPDRLDARLKQAALASFERIDPCAAAAYYYKNWWTRDADGKPIDAGLNRASTMVARCIATRGDREAPYGYYLWALIRQAAGNPDEAADHFASSENLQRRAAPFWRRWTGTVRYLPALYAHWGNVLMDIAGNAESVGDRARMEAALADARRRYSQALRADRRSALAYNGLGNALLKLRATDAAIETYIAGAKANRFDPLVRHSLANALLGRLAADDPAKVDDAGRVALRNAEKNHRKAANLVPDNAYYAASWGASLLLLAKVEDARLARPGLEAAAIVTTSAARARHLADAETAFQRALAAAGGEHWAAHEGLAEVAALAGRPGGAPAVYEKALAVYQRSAERRPADPDAKVSVARALLALDRDAEALATELAAAAADPAHVVARYIAACVARRQNRPDDARAAIAEVQRRTPGARAEGMLRRCLADLPASGPGR